MPRRPITTALVSCALLALSLSPQSSGAHGSVALEDDLCAIQIGYFKAHFKIYLPRTRQHRDFCEDIPEAGESVFVMEYMHSGLGEIPLDFRIIRDVTGLGRFARWRDVQGIEDLDAATVFYQPPAVVPGVYTALYRFDEAGDYIGIVTAGPGAGDRIYTAVFPFEVGFTGFGYWPVFVLLAVIIQLNYFYMRGWFRRRRPESGRLTVVPGA